MGLLPTGASKPDTDLSRKTLVVYGAPGVGKTQFASTFPKALFIPTEPGTLELEVARCPEAGSWSDFRAYVDALSSEEHDFETIVVDTVVGAYKLCVAHVCEVNGWSDPSEPGYGKGWRALATEWEGVMNRLRLVKRPDGRPVCVVLIDHEREESIIEKRGSHEKDTGRKHITGSLPGQGRKIVFGMVQHVFRLEVSEGGRRVLRTQPRYDEGTADIFAKSRGPLNVSLPSPIPLSKNPARGFASLALAWSETFGPSESAGWSVSRRKKPETEATDGGDS